MAIEQVAFAARVKRHPAFAAIWMKASENLDAYQEYRGKFKKQGGSRALVQLSSPLFDSPLAKRIADVTLTHRFRESRLPMADLRTAMALIADLRAASTASSSETFSPTLPE